MSTNHSCDHFDTLNASIKRLLMHITSGSFVSWLHDVCSGSDFRCSRYASTYTVLWPRMTFC